MLEYVNIEVLASLVVMMRSGAEGAILLSDDDEESRFYEGIAHEDARIIPASQCALRLLHMMEKDGIEGLAAAVRGAKPQPSALNVFQPLLGDSTSLLLLSRGSEKVMRDICGNPWLVACHKEVGPVRLTAVWLARTLDQMQHLCTQHSVPLPSQIDAPQIIDWGRFELSWLHLTPILLNSGLPRSAIERLRAIQPDSDLRAGLLECDGMEVVRIISAATALYRPRGIAASKEIDANNLASMLRVAFDPAEFEEDEVFWRVRLWERTNNRYPLLRQWRILDPLGVAWDQRYWERDLPAMLNTLRPAESLAMYQMDLDDFGAVNKAVGHAGGDEAIRLYCRVVNKVLGAVGEVYRRGGDEIVVLAPGVCETVALELAEKTRVEIETSLQAWAVQRGLHSAPTASIGIALGTAGKSSSELSQLADQAQRQAKEQGKNRVVFLR
jgi:diguanylate cyclase (GGDEF)-like protein